MRKAIQLRVTLWIEGDDAPAHDFSTLAKHAVRDIVAHSTASHPELSVRVKKIEEDDDGGDS
jgi:hypothetical protein